MSVEVFIEDLLDDMEPLQDVHLGYSYFILVMYWLVYIISFLIICTKLLDCISTSMRLRHYSEERNPLARYLMKRMGIQVVIWGIFVLTILVVGAWLYLLHFWYRDYYWKLFYVIVGALVSLVQFSVAHTNYTRRLNPITRILKNFL